MASRFGRVLTLQLFGESHGEAVGGVLEGLPAGFCPDMEALRAFLARRAPGRKLTTARQEKDEPRFVSGFHEGKVTGTPLTVLFENADVHSGDYSFLPDVPRPGHADYPAAVRSGGAEDLRGGGHHSGRLTLPVCCFGGLALQYLERKGIRCMSHLLSLGSVEDFPFDPMNPAPGSGEGFPTLSPAAALRMEEELTSAAEQGDSLGAVVECAFTGLPAGLGAPYFDGLKAAVGAAVLSVPGVKGIEFGAGFAAARMRGSMYNDPYRADGNRVVTAKNDAGGICGGMTTGMPLVFRCVFRPAASVTVPQNTLNLRLGETVMLTVPGRHDPCPALRGIPAVEASAALALLDLYLESRIHLEEETHATQK